MEEKIVGNKKEDLPSLDLFHSLISIVSLIYLSIYLVCVQSTTPLWFTDTDVRSKERSIVKRENTRLTRFSPSFISIGYYWL